jgi:Carboxypeptidase regulatory-like domain
MSIGTNRRARSMPQALFLSAAGLAAWMVCSSFLLLAQDRTASLSGVLQDPTGAAIGGYWNAIGEYAASVTLEAAEGGLRQVTHPDRQGRFHFSGLPAGTYTVSTRSPYFDSLKIEQTLLAGEETSWPPVRLVQAGSGCSFSQKIDPVSTRFLAAGPAFGAWGVAFTMVNNHPQMCELRWLAGLVVSVQRTRNPPGLIRRVILN